MRCELKKWKYLHFVHAEQTAREHKQQHNCTYSFILVRIHTHTHDIFLSVQYATAEPLYSRKRLFRPSLLSLPIGCAMRVNFHTHTHSQIHIYIYKLLYVCTSRYWAETSKVPLWVIQEHAYECMTIYIHQFAKMKENRKCWSVCTRTGVCSLGSYEILACPAWQRIYCLKFKINEPHGV